MGLKRIGFRLISYTRRLIACAAAWCALTLSGAVAAQATETQDASSMAFEDWTALTGNWQKQEDLYVQSDAANDCRTYAPLAKWNDYVFEVEARKTGGAEGFLILFRVEDRDRFYWWNVGGWGNQRHAVERSDKGRNLPTKPGSIETGKWYRIRVVVKGPAIQCYLDGELIHDFEDDAYKCGGIGLGSWGTQVEYRNPVVRALDGALLYGANTPEVVRAMLDRLGKAADAFEPEFQALNASGVPAEDAKWRDLYRRMAAARDRLTQALADVEALDLTAIRNDLERLIQTYPDSESAARSMLQELASHEPRLAQIKTAIEAGAESAVSDLEEVRGFIRKAENFHRDLYVRRCPPVVFIKRQAHARKGTNGTMLGQINGGAKMGSSICVYDPNRPEAGTRTVFTSDKGFIFDMSLSYDARKILFSFMDNVKENIEAQKDSFHIWEINLDGTGLRQLTDGPFHDGSPVYLPDGRIVFCSTRVESFSLCQDFLAAALFVIDGDGGNLRRIEYNTLCDTTPYVMDDGAILFTRWEYQDKNIFCVQGLWTINPDGSRLQLFHGNTFTIPNSVYGAKQIPGTRKAICTMAPHHGLPLGAIGLIDRSLGLENPVSMVNLTPEIPYKPTVAERWNEPSPNFLWGAGDVQYAWAYGDPYPISENLFLVTYGGPLQGGPGRYRLYLLDDQGGTAPLYDDPETSCFYPIPLVPRRLPHTIPGEPPKDATGEGEYLIADIYKGLEEKGVKRGQVKQLRIMSQVPKKYNTEGPRYHDHYPVMGQGSYYAKSCYGTVPVDDDGTAYFKVPAGVELYFIALDAAGKEVRRMGTITQITAGERQSCIGCHESRFQAPPPRSAKVMERLAQGPDTITPPPWGAGPVSFIKQVQPVLDRYCGDCHGGRAPKGGVDLSSGRTRFYNIAYQTLLDRNLVEYYYINQAPTGNFQPFESGSWVSKLTKMIESKHAEVDMADIDRRRIYSWIDANAPYYDTWEMSRPYTTGGRDLWQRLKEPGKPGPLEPEPWYAEFETTFKQNCGACHSWPAETPYGPDASFAWINLSEPEHSRVLNAHLSKAAGGMGITKKKMDKSPPIFADADDPIYQALLKAIQQGNRALAACPRMDMPGGVAIAQQRNFGKLY